MTESLGSVDMDCPVCGRTLHVPVHLRGPVIMDMQVIASVVPDTAYLEAHWLTHGPHEGEPLPAAA